MSEKLYVTHSIHLSKEQRDKIQTEILTDVIGVSVPVKIDGKDTPIAREVFCKYKIYHADSKYIITTTNDGYEICLPRKDYLRRLRDIKDGGSGSVVFSCDGEVDGIFTIHQVSIASLETLERTMFCVHLDQTSSK